MKTYKTLNLGPLTILKTVKKERSFGHYIQDDVRNQKLSRKIIRYLIIKNYEKNKRNTYKMSQDMTESDWDSITLQSLMHSGEATS